jgi:hypothetical protein
MADIIELEIVGKVTNLKPMLSTVARLERELVRATKALDQNKISQQRYNTIIASTKTQYAALGVSAQRANSQVDKMAMSLKNTQAAEKAAQATRNLAREKDMLARKYKPLYSAIQMYKKSLAEIKRANELGIISDKQRKSSIMQLKAGFQQASTGMSSGVAQASRSTNQLGVVAQQTGYQVGDFLVQIQSGANPMMAFGQQATQLVGVLPLLSDQLGISAGKLMGIAAGLGIVIPLVTAIAGYFLRSRKAAKDAAGGLDTFEERLKSARSEVKGMAADLKLMNSGFSDTTELTFNEAVDAAVESLKEAREEVAALTSEAALMGLGAAGGIDIVGLFKGDPIEAARERIELAREELRNAILIRKSHERVKEVTGDTNELILAGNAATIDRNRVNMQTIANSEAELKMLKLILKSGEDSVEVVRARAEQEAIALNLTTANQAKYIDLAVEIDAAEQAIDDSTSATADLADGLDDVGKRARDAANGVMSILGALRATLRELDAQEAGLAAAQKVISSGGSEIDGKVIQAGIEFESSVSAKGLDGPELQAAVAQEMANERRRLENQQLESTMYDVFNTGGSSGGSSGGGSQASDKPDFVEALEAEMVVRGELVKLYGDEYELQSEIARIVKGLGEDSGDYNAQSIAALAQQNILLKEQEVLRDESAAQMENIYQMLGDEMGTAFTSMIDGTKSVEDAFKSMAKNIIDQLIQIFIVEQMVNSISGGLRGLFGGGGGSSMQGLTPNPHTASGFNANGNVFSGGSQVQAYANGGIVNSPTMFPMNGNKTGLMGEDGPEAIMPLKRGANGKLGVQAEGSGKGGDNVVIHQNFNFQANGDDTVKKLIQQAAPQIAQMTKSSMLNDRRRGGQTKSVFG